ncbi:MAG: elongation factor P maturation arginine rhamnosyltransferase EarP [Hydrogenophaga sp.]|nr:elongation factor P maturation arginine rhamnosyltransferase EarP [Hydrogenophaga sp.]
MTGSAPPPASPLPPLLWDVFCHVVDNLGDLGVCWRFSADLAARGHQVRLWVDQPEPLWWMAPGALEGRHTGISVREWAPDLSQAFCDPLPPADVWVETFGSDPPTPVIEALAQRLASGQPPPVWINLEYLSAEPYVERCHRLASPVMSGPLKGLTKWFFYPGFTAATGGLLRESDLQGRQAAFDLREWQRRMKLSPSDARQVTLFCYEPPLLQSFLEQASSEDPTVQWLVTSGRPAEAFRLACERAGLKNRIHPVNLSALAQRDFDELLWASDLNLVRGEDSLVRALWAGQAFVWNIYPQHDNAHHAKLEAFLDWLDAPESLRRFHRMWNGLDGPTLPAQAWAGWAGWSVLEEWRSCAQAARARLLAQPDLTTRLLEFIAEKR